MSVTSFLLWASLHISGKIPSKGLLLRLVTSGTEMDCLDFFRERYGMVDKKFNGEETTILMVFSFLWFVIGAASAFH